MAAKTEAYVDTSALISFADGSDTYHPLFRQLFSEPTRLVTTPLVIAEGQGWFLKRYDRNRALQFIAMIDTMRILKILTTTPIDVKNAVTYLRQFSDQELTLVDAMGLHVMNTRNITTCWSTDFHLTLTGVPLVIHQY